jgi:hypothetical protein
MGYLNLRSLHRLIGSNYPLGVNSLAESIEKFLQELTKGGDRLPQILLEHNLSGKRDRETCQFAHVDADLVFRLDVPSRHLDMGLTDYRINTQYARNEAEQRVVFHLHMTYTNNTKWAISVPLQALMKGFGDVENGYMCYSHSIALLNGAGHVVGDEQFYCGITSRNWLQRMAEHFREIQSGSDKLFHRAWRNFQGRSDVLLNSELVALNHTFEGAMGWEEWIVDRYMAAKTSLNMISGGFKGLRELHKLGYLNHDRGVSVMDRDKALFDYAKEHPRIGVPNLLIAGLWEDDEYYARVIQSRDNTLSKVQILQIRELYNQGFHAKEITEKVGARNIGQVRRVIAGKSYIRMK